MIITHNFKNKTTLIFIHFILIFINNSVCFSNPIINKSSSLQIGSNHLIEKVSNLNLNDFIMTWDLASPSGPINEIYFEVETVGLVNYSWQEVSPGNSSGSGTFTGTTFNLSGLPSGSIVNLIIESTNLKRVILSSSRYNFFLKDIKQWGTVAWTSMENAFAGCNNLNITATDIPNLSNVTSMAGMFLYCRNLNGPSNIGLWDVSNVLQMQYLFKDAEKFNQNIDSWNVINVQNMTYMFNGAEKFNKAIGSWNVSNVTNMTYMFLYARDFNQDIGGWDVSNVTLIYGMFYGANSFNQNINSWNVSKIYTFSQMFREAYSFNQPLNSWDVSNAGDISWMFEQASTFNQDLSGWNVSNIRNMALTFSGARSFNQDISNWNVSNVTNMTSMFSNVHFFNHDISNWNVSNVTIMHGMFFDAKAFNQNIGIWNVSNVTDMSSMFSGAISFNQNISNWNVSNVSNMSWMFADAKMFNQNIESWNTSKVTDMTSMFRGASAFNQNINSWNVANVYSMRRIFQNATSFNQIIDSWQVNKVTDMGFAFNGAIAFNGNISSWNVSLVSDMEEMFNGATNFNQDISNWNVSNVKSMFLMFYEAKSFNQSIGRWNISKVQDMSHMFKNAIAFDQSLKDWGIKLQNNINLHNLLWNSGLSIENYDSTLIGFYQSNLTGKFLGITNLSYCSASSQRTNLTKPVIDGGKGWVIYFDNFSDICLKPEIKVIGNSIEILNSENSPSVLNNTDFGNVDLYSEGNSKSFFIVNSGTGNLNLFDSPNKVNLIGSTDFTIIFQPNSPISSFNGSSYFQVLFRPTSTGIKTAIININNNDSDENPYTFSVQGIGINPCPNTLNLISPINDVTDSNIFRALHSINASNRISNTGNVIMKTNNSINLLPGFIVENGAIFKAEISGCP